MEQSKIYQEKLDKIFKDLNEDLRPWSDAPETEAEEGFAYNPIPDDYQATESETFYSILESRRDSDRKRLVNTTKKSEYFTPLDRTRRFDETELTRLGLEGERTMEAVDRRRESVSRTYRDFVEHKKTKKVEARIQELESLGIENLQPSVSPQKFFSDAKTSSKIVKSSEFMFEEDQYEDDDFGLGGGGGGHRVQNEFGDLTLYSDVSYDDIFGEEFKFSDQEELPEAVESPDEDEDEEEKRKEAQKEDIKKRVPFSDLVEDTYYPGVIDDAVNGRLNFYQVAFDMSLGSGDNLETEPDDGPPSLIEAFDMRYKLETEQRKQETLLATKQQYDEDEIPGAVGGGIEDQTAEGGGGAVSPAESTPKTFMEFLTGTRIVNRDEVLLANAVEIDLTNIVRNRPDTELINAINSLFKADLMNNYDKSMQAAEEAYENAPPDLAETMAIHKANTFKTTELKRMKTVLPSDKSKSYNPIEIISYMGVTKPVILDEDQQKREEKDKSKPVKESPFVDATQIEESEDVMTM